MAVFDAAAIVEQLDFTFDSCKGAHGGPCWRGPDNGPRPPACTVFVPGCHGTVQEPDDKQIATFWADLRKLTADTARHAGEISKALAEAGADDGDGTAEAAAVLDDAGAAVELHRRTAEIYSALCSGSPSEEELLGLPMRIRIRFYSWLREEVMNPEAVAGGGNAQVRPLRSAAAG